MTQSLPLHSGHNRLFALLLVTLLTIYTELTSCSLPGSVIRQIPPSESSDPHAEGFVTSRHYKLFSSCSHWHVQIKNKRFAVNARAGAHSAYADLIVTSDRHSGGRVTVKGNKTKRYLCFTRRARLVLRKRPKDDWCVFVEHLTPDGYTKLQSAANERWFVGFSRSGRPLKGFGVRTRARRAKGLDPTDRHILKRRKNFRRHRRKKSRRRKRPSKIIPSDVHPCFKFTKRDFDFMKENGYKPISLTGIEERLNANYRTSGR